MEIACSSCGRRLQIGDEHAGKKARCPHCQNIFDVPAPGLLGPRTEWNRGTREADDALWRMRGADGITYGPVARGQLDQWVAEGRVTAETELLREGAGDWQRAAELYPQLRAAGGFAPAPGSNPFGERPESSNPYAAPTVANPTVLGTYAKAHRGGMILTLGIVGVLCCQCLAPVAWIMGHNDLQEMKAGRMDPSGQGLTQAGMIMGIVGTALMVLSVGINGLMVALQAVQ